MRHLRFSAPPFAATALWVAAALLPAQSLAQSQLPRPAQLPPAGGQPPRGPAPAAQAPRPPGGADQPVLGQPRPQPQQQQPQQTAKAKPYTPVTIGAPAPVNDPSFEAFRQQVEAAAKAKNKTALAKLVVAKEFFWEGEKGDKADKKKSGVDNLAAALSLNVKDGSGWEALAGFVADPTAAPMPGRRTGVICGPAEPVYDAAQLGALTKATGTEESDWGYPVQPGLEVRGAAQPTAPVIEKIGMQFVWVMPEEQPGNVPSALMRVVTPSGKLGYVPAEAISPLGSDQVCYAKDASGAWKIAGFIGDQ